MNPHFARLIGVFVSQRRLRPLWRAVIFFLVGQWILAPLLFGLHPTLERILGLRPGLSAGQVALSETMLFIVALICTSVFAAYEKRRPDAYGLPLQAALSRDTFEGAACGVVMAAIVAVGMLSLGGMQIHGFAASGRALAWSALVWLGANVCVGVAEEFWYRSYLLQTLWRSIGFWPGATLIAVVFTADHYFYKTGENIWDVVTLMSLSLLVSYSVRRTGTLWFAVGFHIAFDYMQLFVIGTPNGSAVPVGRMLDVSFSGPAWLTGGVLGTEASFLMYPTIAALWVYVWWRFRDRPEARAIHPPLRPELPNTDSRGAQDGTLHELASPKR